MSRCFLPCILLLLLVEKSSGSAATTISTATTTSKASESSLTPSSLTVSTPETVTAKPQDEGTETAPGAESTATISPPSTTSSSTKSTKASKTAKPLTPMSRSQPPPPSQPLEAATAEASTPSHEQKGTSLSKEIIAPTANVAATSTRAVGTARAKPSTPAKSETATSAVSTTTATTTAPASTATAAAISSPPLNTKSSTISSSDPAEKVSTNSLVDWWLEARCGHYANMGEPQDKAEPPRATAPALWIYQGRLLDPLLGKEIAHVQGIEVVQRVNTTTHLRQPQGQDSLLSLSSSEACQSATIKSRKLFCYTAPNDDDDDDDDATTITNSAKRLSQNILQRIQLRPGSKSSKHIPLQQAISVYDSTVTFLTRKSKKQKDAIVYTQLNQDDDLDADGKNSGEPRRVLWARAKCSCKRDENDEGRKILSVSLYAQPPPPIKQASKVLSDLIRQFLKEDDHTSTSRAADSSDTPSIRPQRAALVQFGPQQPQQQQQQRRGSGAMETYQYTIPDEDSFYTYLEYEPSTASEWIQQILLGRRQRVPAAMSPPTVRYTRYGEGPVWYGPGRPCALELTGKQITDAQQIPPVLAKTISNHLPDFFSTTATSEKPIRLSLKESTDMPSSLSNRWNQWKQQIQNGSVAAWDKIGQATSIQTTIGKELE